jgi:hypothetical protein
VSHKESEHHLKGYIGKVPYTMASEHWWNLDGTNEFRDFDTVVLTSLPHLPETWAINTFMACQGIQGAEWLLDDVEHPWEEYPDIRNALLEGKMVASMIQAVNRIRCRKTIDALGNCPPADIFIKFNTEKQAKDILGQMLKAMPGMTLKTWEFDPNKAPRKPRKTVEPDAAQKLLGFLENMKKGRRLEKKTVIGQTSINPRTMTRLLDRLRNPLDDLAVKVKSLCVQVYSGGNGRGDSTYFEKF